MKTIVVYHKIDLDGWMSAAIVKYWFIKSNKNPIVTDENNNQSYHGEDRLHMLGWNYGDDIPDLSDYDKVIMVDVAFSKDKETGRDYMIELYDRLSNDFTWIDHHISAIKENGIDLISGIQDTDFAACELTWKFFFPKEKIPEIVRLLGRYDCFGHKGTDEEQKVLEFQYGARQVIGNYNKAYDWLQREINEGAPLVAANSILNKGVFIYEYLCTEAEQIYKKAFEVDFKNPDEHPKALKILKFLCVNQERFNPINFGIDYHKDGCDGFACFWYKDGKWHWSLYNDNGEVDVSKIAKEYGGGGHKGASGFRCDTKTLLRIISP